MKENKNGRYGFMLYLSFRKETHMRFAEKIFERATVKGVADYLLYGMIPEQDERDYKTRLDDADLAFEEASRQYGEDGASVLLSAANTLVSENASVYMELGLQAGILLISDILKNASKEPGISSGHEESCTTDHCRKEDTEEKEEHETSVLRQFIRYRLDTALEKALRKDHLYQKAKISANKKAEKLDKSIFTPEQLELIDDALSEDSAQASEYGRAAYQQGLLDTLEFFKELFL